MRKGIVALFAAILLLMSCQAPMVASAASSSEFKIQSTQAAVAGGYAEVTVSYTGTKEKVGGLQFHLEFDSSVLSYVAGSREVLVTGIADNELGTDSCVGNRIHFVWEAAKNQGVTVQGDIVTYRFKVNPDLADTVSQTPVKLVVQAFYKDDYPIMTDYIYSEVTTSCNVLVSTNSALKDAIDKINAIGEVVYDEDTKNRIHAAREAYNALSPSLRENVSNSDVLFSAEKRYEELMKQSGVSLLQQKVDTFRNAHKEILETKLDDLTLEDKELVEAAVSAWEALDVETRAATIADKRQLNKFLLKIEALESDADAWKEAEDMARMLRDKYSGILKLDPNISDDLLLENESSVEKFMDEIEDNAVYVKYLPNVMADDIDFLNAFLNRLANMDRPGEENAEAQAFKQEFGWLLNYTEENVLKSDVPDLQTALYAYGLLSDEAKAALEGVEAHLTALYEKAKSLPDEVIKEVITETKTEIVYVDKEVEVEVQQPAAEEEENHKFMVKLPGEGINPLVWWMLGFAVFMVVALSAELCIFSAIRRKKNQQEVVGA